MLAGGCLVMLCYNLERITSYSELLDCVLAMNELIDCTPPLYAGVARAARPGQEGQAAALADPRAL